jgi:hypothetical protein
MLIPKTFVIKCVLNRDAYLNGCVLKWEATVFAVPNWSFTLLDYYTSSKRKFVVCSTALGGDALIEIVTL